MGKTPKEIRDAAPGVAARDNVIHASTSTSNNESVGILSEDVSRVQSAAKAYAMIPYKLGDLVVESDIIYRNITPIAVGEAFMAAKWKAVGGGDLQSAYDGGNEIKETDPDGLKTNTPIKITVADIPTANKGEYAESGESYIIGDIVTLTSGSFVQTFRSLEVIADPAGVFDPTKWVELTIFQPVIQVKDLQGDIPLILEGSGEIEQKPLNLKLVDTLIPPISELQNVTLMRVHSRFLFAANISTGIEVYSLSNPEKPELLTTIATPGDIVVGLLHHGDILYVMDRVFPTDTLRIIDIGNPFDPKELGSVTTGSLGTNFNGGKGMQLQGNLLFLPDGGGGSSIDVLDVSDPTNLRLVNTITDGVGGVSLDSPALLRIHENFLFVYNEGDLSVSVIDISDILNPIGISNIVNGTDGAVLDDVDTFHVTRDVVHFCNRSSKTFQVIDYADPAVPVVKASITDPSLEAINSCVIAGRFVYLLNSDTAAGPPRDIMIATIDIQDADNLIFLQNKAFASANAQGGALVITGDHLYATINAGIGTDKRLYSLRNSGLETQSMRAGTIRVDSIDVKGETTTRTIDVSESLEVGGRGILSNGQISGQKGSQIKRPTTTVIRTGTIVSDIILDMSQDISIYIIDLTGSASGVWPIDVINQRPGNKILIKALLTAFDADAIFSDAKFAIDTGNTDTMSVDGDLAVLECVLDDDSTNSIIATVTEIA